MEKTLLTLLEISAGSAVVILIISLLSTIINRRFTAKWKYFIWLIIAIRLLLPFNPSFNIGQPKLEVSIPNTSVVVPITQTPSVEEVQPDFVPPATDEQIVPVSPTKPEEKTFITVDLVQILGLVWLVGTVAFLGIHIGSYVIFKKKHFRWARPVNLESRTYLTKEMLQKELGISTPIPVLICTNVTSPMMIGFFKSFLILPHENYSDSELYFILRHELTHFKRHDIWYKLLMLLANAVHWFNPAVWLMVRESSRDLEISCDSAVVRGADPQSRRLYSEIILANVRPQSNTTALSTYFYDGKKSLKERFRNILNSKKRQKGLVCFVAVVLCIGLVGGVVSCSFADNTELSSSNSSSAEEENLFYVVPLMEQERINTWINTFFPNITDWRVVFEYHTYATEENLKEDGLYEWPKGFDSLKGNSFAVLATEQSSSFDRVLISFIDNYELTQTDDGKWICTPVKIGNSLDSPIMITYRGFESEWQLGDCKDAEFICRTGMNKCTFWFPEKSEALIFADSSRPALRLKDVTEKPDVCRRYYSPYHTSALRPEQKDDLLLFFYKLGRNDIYAETSQLAFYSGEKLTYLEDLDSYYSGHNLTWLNDTTFAIGVTDRVCLYDISLESFGKPINILGGDGYGLADSDAWICSQIETDKTKPTRHCIMYYTKDKREWHICTFDTSGNIISNFSTGLDVADETLVLVNYIDGLVYFLHYPNGATKPSMRYCVDARPDKNHTPIYTP